MRVDLVRPMTKGNFIVLKGSSLRGKTALAHSTIKQFLEEDEEHRAIYVGLTPNSGQRLLESLSNDIKPRAMALGIQGNPGELSSSSDAEFLLAPHAALRASLSCKKVLLVFDDVITHKLKENLVFDLASQPFSPFNIVNELFDHTGCFSDGRVVSTIVLADTEANQLQFKKDEDALVAHLESISDQIIDFADEQHKRRLGSALPVLPSKPG